MASAGQGLSSGKDDHGWGQAILQTSVWSLSHFAEQTAVESGSKKAKALKILRCHCWHEDCFNLWKATIPLCGAPYMSIQVNTTGTEVVAVLIGDLTLYTMNSYLSTFVELSTQGWNDVVLDMTGISSLDTAGAGLLLALRDRLAGQGLELRLSCPQPGPLLLLRQAGLDLAITIDTARADFEVLH
jgi:anti-anti-sigma factor